MASFYGNYSKLRPVKGLPKTWQKKVLEDNLAEIRELLTFERACLGRTFGGLREDELPLPTSEEEVTAFIANRTRIYFQNITECLDAIEETLPEIELKQ